MRHIVPLVTPDNYHVISIEQALAQKFPHFLESLPRLVQKPIVRFLGYIFRETEINQFLSENEHLKDLAFVEKVLEHLDFAYSVSNKQKENIPSTGRVLIVANHPLGALDALALIQMIGEIRSDIRVVATDFLSNLQPMESMLLPVNNLGKGPGKENVKRILNALGSEQAVIVFPADEVSRARPQGVRDSKWRPGFVHFARKTASPIVPVYIEGRNSRLFYGVSAVWKPLAALLLAREMFKQRSRTLHFRVGAKIPFESLLGLSLTPKAVASLVKRHLYRIGTKRKGIFQTERAIAHPEPPKTLKAELRSAELLGETTDKKLIYLIDYQQSPSLVREIGRLRELSFRKVGEGTGLRRDTDHYDHYYKQILLWDEQELEIVGAYRIGEGKQIMDKRQLRGLYISSLFKLSEEFAEYANNGIELGRSFVQPRYWGSRALDYLWQGIGAYLAKNPDVKWLFGPISISNSYPKGAKDLLVYFYQRYFGSTEEIAHCRQPYLLTEQDSEQMSAIFCANDYKQNFGILKGQLAHYEVRVPTLFKQYTELFEQGGVHFHGFNIDPNFNHCVDGLIVSELSSLKPSKYERYIGSNLKIMA